jgi:hypothetical protein
MFSCMPKPDFLSWRAPACILLAFALFGCSPTFDWREVRGGGAPYSVLFPAKPTAHTRSIDLDGMQATMTMTAAEADGVLFAVGAAQLADPAAAQRALPAMRTALLRNIKGTLRREGAATVGGSDAALEIEAAGAADRGTGDQPRVLFARFVASGPRVYQLVVTGKEKAVPHEAVDTFFTSFKPE